MSHVVEINDLDDLAGYRLAWTSLLAETPAASFFHTLDWLEVYWKHYGESQKLRVLIVYADDRPVGILPLCVRREQYKVGSLRVLTYPLHDWGAFYGPIGPNPTATLLAGMRHVKRTRRDWDLLDLRWVDADRIDRGRTARAMEQVGFQADKQPMEETSIVDLSSDWEQYLAARTSKWRNNYRRHEKRLGEQGEVVLVRHRPQGDAYGDGDPRWDMYAECEQIAAKSWQGEATDGTTLSHEEIRPFLREAHARAAKVGMLDMNVMYVGDHPTAFAYNYVFAGRVYGLRIGFDQEFSRSGAGNVLYARVFRDSFARGDVEYDMGPGSQDAKRQFVTEMVKSYRFTYFPRAVKPQILRAKRFAQAWRASRRASVSLAKT